MRSGGPPGGGSILAQAERAQKTARTGRTQEDGYSLRPSPSSASSPPVNRHPSISRLRASTPRWSRHVASFSRSPLDDVGRRARDELLVPELLLLRIDQPVEPVDLGAQPAALAPTSIASPSGTKTGVPSDSTAWPPTRSVLSPNRDPTPWPGGDGRLARAAAPRCELRSRPPGAHRLPRLDGVLRPDAADGADQLLHQAEVAAGRRDRRRDRRPGPGRDRDRGVGRAGRKAPPERLGDEGHDRMEQPERRRRRSASPPPERRRRRADRRRAGA